MKLAASRKRTTLMAAAALVIAGGMTGAGYVWAQTTPAPAPSPAPQSAAPAPQAAAPVDPNKVVATVNGQKITEGDLAVAQKDLTDELSQTPGQTNPRQALIDAVVNLTLISQAADAAKLSDAPEFKSRMALLRERVLRSAYIQANLGSKITDDVLKKRYDEEVSKIDSPEEVKAAHILVDTEAEANAIIDQLKKGGDFAAIAKEKSKDTGSAVEGGELGYFSRGQMVKEFEDAAFGLTPGQYTQTPIKTQFGFHVIKVEDKRKQPPPAFDEVKDEVQQMVMADLYQTALKGLRDSAKIELADPAK